MAKPPKRWRRRSRQPLRPASHGGGVYFVDLNSSAAAPDGSESAPFRTIQEGIDAASAGDTVWVASGTESNPKTYLIDTPVTVNKDISVIAQSDNPRATVIDAQGKSNCVHLQSKSLFAGFTVTNGTYGITRTRYWNGADTCCGAGFIINGGTVSNCVATHCSVDAPDLAAGGASAAGAYINSRGLMTDSQVLNCWTKHYSTENNSCGGGVTVTDGVLRNSLVSNCWITTDLKIKIYGGGVAMRNDNAHKDEPLIVEGCEIVDCYATNTAYTVMDGYSFYAHGGGMYYQGADADIGCITNTLVKRCRAFAGGGLYQARGNGITLEKRERGHLADVTFEECAAFIGAAVCNATTPFSADGCVFAGNYLIPRPEGSSLSDQGILKLKNDMALTNCVFKNNLSYNLVNTTYTPGRMIFSDTVFLNNTNDYTFGVVSGNANLIRNSSYWAQPGEATFDRCRFVGNVLVNRSGGSDMLPFEVATIRNSLITGNRGFAYFNKKSFLEFASNTVWGNDTYASHTAFLNFTAGAMPTNCVFVKCDGDTGKLMTDMSAAGDAGPSYCYCYTEAGALLPEGNGNINGAADDPTFEDAAAGNFAPAQRAPFRDHGAVAPGAEGDWDLGDGTWTEQRIGKYGVRVVANNSHRRIMCGAPDMGCCERYVKPGLVLCIR